MTDSNIGVLSEGDKAKDCFISVSYEGSNRESALASCFNKVLKQLQPSTIDIIRIYASKMNDILSDAKENQDWFRECIGGGKAKVSVLLTKESDQGSAYMQLLIDKKKQFPDRISFYMKPFASGQMMKEIGYDSSFMIVNGNSFIEDNRRDCVIKGGVDRPDYVQKLSCGFDSVMERYPETFITFNSPDQEEGSSYMDTYKKDLNDAYKNSRDTIFSNEGVGHAAVLLSTIFSNANEEVLIFGKSLRDKLTSCQEYVESLSACCNRGVRVQVLLDEEHDECKKSFIRRWLESMSARKENVDVYTAKNAEILVRKYLPNATHFTVADGRMYRLEYDRDKFKAFASMNDSRLSKVLCNAFKDTIKNETDNLTHVAEVKK